jgi:hypothetical protein
MTLLLAEGAVVRSHREVGSLVGCTGLLRVSGYDGPRTESTCDVCGHRVCFGPRPGAYLHERGRRSRRGEEVPPDPGVGRSTFEAGF